MVKDGPALSLSDEKGSVRVSLSAGKNGQSLSLYDEKELSRAVLKVDQDGPWLRLYDQGGKNIVSIQEDPKPPAAPDDERLRDR